MIKEHAELLAKKQNERRIDIGRLTSYPEYYVLKEELEKMIKEFENIDYIDEESNVSIEIQVKANKFAKERLKRFLSDMNVYSSKANDTRDETYN